MDLVYGKMHLSTCRQTPKKHITDLSKKIIKPSAQYKTYSSKIFSKLFKHLALFSVDYPSEPPRAQDSEFSNYYYSGSRYSIFGILVRQRDAYLRNSWLDYRPEIQIISSAPHPGALCNHPSLLFNGYHVLFLRG